MAPPRALKVPFELGRPLGEPGDPAFQGRVLDALFALLGDSGPGPIVAEFDEDAPSTVADGEVWSCPVSFPVLPDDSLSGRLQAEVAALMPWFQRAGEHKPSGTGTSGLAIDEVVERLTIAERGDLAELVAPDELALGDWLKLMVEDFKLFYAEAMGAQPKPPGSAEFAHWFWSNSEGGALVRRLREVLSDHEDKVVRTHARFTFVPSELH